MLKKIITIIFINFLFPNLETEEYIYDIEIQGLSMIAGNVGRCNLKIEKNEHNEYTMNIITKTTNLAKILYPYIDEIKLKIDKYFSLISIEQKISNRDKKLEINVDKEKKIIIRNGKKLDFYADTLFSPYSLIHFLRKQKIELNNQYVYKIFDGRKRDKYCSKNCIKELYIGEAKR